MYCGLWTVCVRTVDCLCTVICRVVYIQYSNGCQLTVYSGVQFIRMADDHGMCSVDCGLFVYLRQFEYCCVFVDLFILFEWLSTVYLENSVFEWLNAGGLVAIL